MKKIGILLATVLVAISGALLAAPPPASAESGIEHDPRGDMPARLDLVKLRATNGQRSIRIALHVRDLEPARGRFQLGVGWSEPGDPYTGFGFYVRAKQTDGGLVTRFHTVHLGSDTDPEWTCAENHGSLAWRADRDRIILRVPQGCLRKYDGWHVVNDWDFYGSTYRYVHGRLHSDAIAIEDLPRG